MSTPLVDAVTLGARDLDRLYEFYEALGFPAVVTQGDMRLSELRGGVLALFGIDSLARDSGSEPGAPDGSIRFSVEILVDAREQVDALAERVREAGGRITKEPVDTEFFTPAPATSPIRRGTSSRSPGRRATTSWSRPPGAPPVWIPDAAQRAAREPVVGSPVT